MLFMIILSIIMVGCTPDTKPSVESDEQQNNGLVCIPFEKHSDDYENIEFEIINPESLEGELKEKLGCDQPEEGKIVFEHGGYNFILVSAGRKPTGGYSIVIGSLEGYENHIVLDALLYSPAEDDDVKQKPSYPSLLIKIPADEREIIVFLSDVRSAPMR